VSADEHNHPLRKGPRSELPALTAARKQIFLAQKAERSCSLEDDSCSRGFQAGDLWAAVKAGNSDLGRFGAGWFVHRPADTGE